MNEYDTIINLLAKVLMVSSKSRIDGNLETWLEARGLLKEAREYLEAINPDAINQEQRANIHKLVDIIGDYTNIYK